MSGSNNSPFFAFLKIALCCGLIFCAYALGDNLGCKRGFQETSGFTLAKLGIEETPADYDEYDAILDAYIAESRTLGKSLENIFSAEHLGEQAGNLVTDFINGLLGE